MTTATWTGSSIGFVNGYGVMWTKVNTGRIEFSVGIVGKDGVVVADEKVTAEFMEQAKMPAQEVVPTTMVLETTNTKPTYINYAGRGIVTIYEVDCMLEDVEKIVRGMCASDFHDIDCHNG